MNISTYAEMALRTAGTRAMLMGEAAQRERLGIDTVLVSQYGACSKTCLPWQGLFTLMMYSSNTAARIRPAEHMA